MKPDWLKTRLTQTNDLSHINSVLKSYNLHTICESGRCPNKAECWSAGVATFLILGDICTRACKFCATKSGVPLKIDKNEPTNIANAVYDLGLKHCVLTSVDRDDLKDGGMSIWLKTIETINHISPQTKLEVLIPDFNGDIELLNLISKSSAKIYSHNLETVRRLTPLVRSKAKYDLSLSVLKYLADQSVVTKSGIMLGLGETNEEVIEAMQDLIANNCKILTIGQYLQPTTKHLKVQKYYSPLEFEKFKEVGLKLGFKTVESGALVRSSYHADKHVL